MQAVRYVGPALVAVLLPFRIVLALVLGLSPLLDENLSPTNFVGVSMVFVVCLWFVYVQYKNKVKAQQEDTDETPVKPQQKDTDETTQQQEETDETTPLKKPVGF